MSAIVTTPLALGRALRRWRLLHRVKQEHAAQIFEVAQSTISRWEAGRQAMEPAERAKIETIVCARLDSAADRVLAELVNESPRPVHLICDLTHCLLACSASRAEEFRIHATELMGNSLLCYATEEILATEESLGSLGWYDEPAPQPIELYTGANGSQIVPIWDSRCRWTRLLLSDGTPARLVETLSRGNRPRPADRSGCPSA